MSDRQPLYAITLWQPWAWAIAYAGKRVENREWHPWPRLIGQLIAIHAGMRWDSEAYEDLLEYFKAPCPPKKESVFGAIVAVARLDRSEKKDGIFIKPEDPWFCGPIGWRLSKVRRFEPVHCKGTQGFWRVEGPVLNLVRERYAAAEVLR